MNALGYFLPLSCFSDIPGFLVNLVGLFCHQVVLIVVHVHEKKQYRGQSSKH